MEDDEPEDESIWDTERLLRWRKVKKASGRWGKEYLVLFKNRPADELWWIPEEQFADRTELEEEIRRDQPTEDTS